MRRPDGRRARVVIFLGVLVLGAAATASDATDTLRRIAFTGDPAPGGGIFAAFSPGAMPIVAPVNARSEVAFFATVGGASAEEGLFLWSRGRTTIVARESDVVGGVGRLTAFARHPILALNDDGTVAFVATLAGGHAVEGLFAARNGRVRALALTGAAAPGFPTGTLERLETPAINTRGDVAFLATVRRGRESIDTILLATGGRLVRLVARGDPAPGGRTFTALGPPALNRHGLVALTASVDGQSGASAIFVADAGGVRRRLGAGEATPIGGVFAKISERVGLDDRGGVGFHGLLEGASVEAGIFAAGEHGPRVVARAGDQAPGGGTFADFDPWLAAGPSGIIACAATVRGGPSPAIIVRAVPGGLQRVAGVGDTLAGRERIPRLGRLPAVSVNASGAVSFAITPAVSTEGPQGLLVAVP